MKLIPLQDRVLIKPDQQPTMTASGLHIAEDWKPEQTGVVVGVGQQKHPRKDEAFELATHLEMRYGSECEQGAQLLRELTGREPEVKEGDHVVFSWNVGNELIVNDGEDRYLLMRESDILAVVDYEDVHA